MVRWAHYSRQGHEINRAINRRNYYQGLINQYNVHIMNWTREYNNARYHANVAYRNKEEKRIYLVNLERKIRNGKQEVIRLTNKRDALQKKIDDLNGIINQSTEQQNEMNNNNNTKKDKLTTDTIPENTRTNLKYYNNMQMQNNALEGNIQELQDEYTTNDQQSLTTYKNTNYYGYIKSILFILYYVMILLFLYMAYSRQYIVNKKILFAIALVIGTYPFYILNVEMYIYESFVYLWALMRGRPYHKE